MSAGRWPITAFRQHSPIASAGRRRRSNRRTRPLRWPPLSKDRSAPANGRQARATAADAGRAAWCRQDDGGGEDDRSRAPSRSRCRRHHLRLARAGGVQQLEAFTRILGLELLTADTPQALGHLLLSAHGSEVIIDTAGASPLSFAEMAGVRALIEQARAEPLPAPAAGADAMEAGDLAAAFAGVGCRRMIATLLHVARRLGRCSTPPT